MADTKFTPGYEITKDGCVFSLETNWRGYGRREMKQSLNASGYPSVRIIIDGKRKHIAVHVLVAKAHLPPRPSCVHEVRHLDGNKLNPNVSNLAWGTRSENALDRVAHGSQYRPPWHDENFRRSQSEAMRLAHERNRQLGVGRYAN